jgi:hypothetical protein
MHPFLISFSGKMRTLRGGKAHSHQLKTSAASNMHSKTEMGARLHLSLT